MLDEKIGKLWFTNQKVISKHIDQPQNEFSRRLYFYARQHVCYSAYMLSPVRLSHGCIIEPDCQ